MTYLEDRPVAAPLPDELPRAPPAPTAAGQTFPLFDSLRGIAALAVFGVHFLFLADFGALGPYMRRLDVGVPLFFVISGFLL